MTDEQVTKWVNRYLYNAIYDTEKGIVKLIFVVGDIGVQLLVPIPIWKSQAPDAMRFVKRNIVLGARKVIHDERDTAT